MKASAILIEKLKEFEGLSLTAYKAVKSERYYTIGYGHYGKDVTKSMRITEQEATRLLEADVERIERDIETLGLHLNQDQHDAVCSFCFNLGVSRFSHSTLCKKIRANAFDPSIAYEFKRWVYAGGRVMRGLVKRRQWELSRYFSLDGQNEEKA